MWIVCIPVDKLTATMHITVKLSCTLLSETNDGYTKCSNELLNVQTPRVSKNRKIKKAYTGCFVFIYTQNERGTATSAKWADDVLIFACCVCYQSQLKTASARVGCVITHNTLGWGSTSHCRFKCFTSYQSWIVWTLDEHTIQQWNFKSRGILNMRIKI